jgi:ankyrin repeat protein
MTKPSSPTLPLQSRDVDSFITSARNGRLTAETIQLALSSGIAVDAVGGEVLNRAPALFWASRHGHTAVVTAVLEAGADSDVCDKYGQSSIFGCAFAGKAEVMRLLIERGGDVNKANRDGCTPLISLVRNNAGDAADRLLVLLERPELDLDVKFEGRTAEQWAREKGHHHLADAVHVEVGSSLTLFFWSESVFVVVGTRWALVCC